jgi:hypothetical protein
MPTYRITGPDGKVYRVTGDGSAEDALAQVKAKVEGAQPEATPQEGPSFLSDLAQGAKGALDRTALGIKGLLPQSVQDFGDRVDKSMGSGGLIPETAAKIPDTAGGMTGSIGTDIGLSLIPGGAALKGGNVLKAALAAKGLKGLGTAAAIGTDVAGNAGAAAAMAPEDRGNAAAWGAGGAAGGRVLARTLGGPLRESVSPQAQKLMDAGVKITPGQALSGPQAGIVARTIRGLEDKLTSIPFLGDVIANAQQSSIKSFNLNKINDAISSVGGKVKNAGIDGLHEADQLVSKTYDDVLPHITVEPNKGLQAIIDAVDAAKKDPLFDVAHGNKLDMFVDRRITPLLAAGKPIDGATAKALDSELGELARKYSASGVGNEPLGKGFYELRKGWRSAFEGTTPEARQTLKNADTAFAKLLPLLKSGEKSASGVFMPKQLSDALRSAKMKPDDLTEAARQVLPTTVADSGTAGRQILANVLHPEGLGAGGAAAAGLAGFMPAAIAGAGAAAMYTRPGLKAATQGVHPLAKALRAKLSQGPYDPNKIEDIIRNLTGRGITATGTE